MFDGSLLLSIRSFFFGANQTAIQKNHGKVRPIAVGCMLSRHVVKVAGSKIMGEHLGSWGIYMRGGLEGAVLCHKGLPVQFSP